MKIDSSYRDAVGAPALWPIGVGVTVLVTGLLAWDHLVGNEPGNGDPFPVDPGAFVLGMATSLICAVAVFGLLIPRTRKNPSTAARRGMWLSGLAVPLAPVATWLGFPLILAGGGIALGLLARRPQTRSRWAITAIVLGSLVLAFGLLATAFPS